MKLHYSQTANYPESLNSSFCIIPTQVGDWGCFDLSVNRDLLEYHSFVNLTVRGFDLSVNRDLLEFLQNLSLWRLCFDLSVNRDLLESDAGVEQ